MTLLKRQLRKVLGYTGILVAPLAVVILTCYGGGVEGVVAGILHFLCGVVSALGLAVIIVLDAAKSTSK